MRLIIKTDGALGGICAELADAGISFSFGADQTLIGPLSGCGHGPVGNSTLRSILVDAPSVEALIGALSAAHGADIYHDTPAMPRAASVTPGYGKTWVIDRAEP